MVVELISKSGDEFSRAVLRSFMRKFSFFGEPLDMAIRKWLMHVRLPKETQQIERAFDAFADRYQECNPGIFSSQDAAHFLAFSIVILHTDLFNPRNKTKMRKPEYVKITDRSPDSSPAPVAVREYIFDNILYTPFINLEDDEDPRDSMYSRDKPKKSSLKGAIADPVKKAKKGPLDPYKLLMDQKLESLRVNLKDIMDFENDPYCYYGTLPGGLDVKSLHASLNRFGVIQIISSRSRPGAFLNQSTIDNPDEAQAGLVDIQVSKVGILWRKNPKKRRPWEEWGAIMTSSGLSFFRNYAWVKNLLHQYESHQKHGGVNPVVFKPPVDNFQGDWHLPLNNIVALLDQGYKKHKYAFLMANPGTKFEEVFLADSEADMNDWIGKINFAAAFKTADINPRGLVSPRRFESSSSAAKALPQSAASDGSSSLPSQGDMSQDLASAIRTDRRIKIEQRIRQDEESINASNGQLDQLLSDARHLQVLTPITAKTREHVLIATMNLAQQVKWTRIEVWFYKCQRDIIAKDLEEETKIPSKEPQQPMAAPSTTDAEPAAFRTPPETSQQPSPTQPPSSYELPPIPTAATAAEGAHSFISFSPPVSPTSAASPVATTETTTASPHRSASTLQHQSPRSPPRPPSLAQRSSISSIADQMAGPAPAPAPAHHKHHSRLSKRKSKDAGNRERREKEKDRDREGEEEQDGGAGAGGVKAEAGGAGAPPPPAQEGVDAAAAAASAASGAPGAQQPTPGTAPAGATTAAPLESERLARTKGSFTIHGKKASVITFGSEWQRLSAEERLKLAKQAAYTGGASGAQPQQGQHQQ
ncbi:hypothetical protein BDY21DRAFT_305451, partial [Lineolata rhizophorae]